MSIADYNARRRSSLSVTKQELLKRRLHRVQGSGTIDQPIVRRLDTDKSPLSFPQERIWLFEQVEPGTATHNIPLVCRLIGRLNVSALEWSLNEIVRRHNGLRATFHDQMGQLWQIFVPNLELHLRLVDLRKTPDHERSAEFLQQATKEAELIFDLKSGPLLRAALFQLDLEEHVLILTIHHIIFDGWSIGIFLREMATLYKAFNSSNRSPLASLPVQYSDFAYWQRDYLQDSRLDKHLTYWKHHLSGNLPLLLLPSKHLRSQVQTFRGVRLRFQLSPLLTEALNALSQREGVTLFMTLLAAFQMLLSRYTGLTDIIIGTPIANRNRSELEGIIGCISNTLVLRVELTGNPTVRELLVRVRDITLEAYDHQDMPYELLVEKVVPERRISHTALFQVMFVLQNVPLPAVTLPDLAVQRIDIDPGLANLAKYDVTLSITNFGKGLTCYMEYNADLFDDLMIVRIAEHFQMILERMVVDIGRRLNDITIWA